MSDEQFQEWIEAGWRRRLTSEEEAQLQAWLAVHPDQQARWESECRLNQALQELPPAPVPSNFTSLVLQAARRDARSRAPRPWWRHLATWLVPRPATGLAWVALVVCASWFAWHQVRVQQVEYRARCARELTILSTAALSSTALMPEPRFLAEDFEALKRLPPSEDDELLAVLHETATNP